jgi:hypothetical protein
MTVKNKTLKSKPAKLPKDLFKAAMFAKLLVEKGTNPGLANYKAGQYYGYSASDVGFARSQLKQTKSIYS